MTIRRPAPEAPPIPEGAQLGLLDRLPLKHHAPRCVCGAPLTWLSSHGAPFDERLCLARPDASGRAEGFHVFDGARTLRRIVLGQNDGDPRGHGSEGFRLHFRLHQCARWNGAILSLTAKEAKR